MGPIWERKNIKDLFATRVKRAGPNRVLSLFLVIQLVNLISLVYLVYLVTLISLVYLVNLCYRIEISK